MAPSDEEMSERLELEAMSNRQAEMKSRLSKKRKGQEPVTETSLIRRKKKASSTSLGKAARNPHDESESSASAEVCTQPTGVSIQPAGVFNQRTVPSHVNDVQLVSRTQVIENTSSQLDDSEEERTASGHQTATPSVRTEPAMHTQSNPLTEEEHSEISTEPATQPAKEAETPDVSSSWLRHPTLAEGCFRT